MRRALPNPWNRSGHRRPWEFGAGADAAGLGTIRLRLGSSVGPAARAPGASAVHVTLSGNSFTIHAISKGFVGKSPLNGDSATLSGTFAAILIEGWGAPPGLSSAAARTPEEEEIV
jgi:hypothetical protein